VLSAGHARALLALPDEQAQDRLAHRIVAEGLSVRAVEEIVAVGDDAAPPARRRTARAASPELADLAARLSDRFETRVRVDQGRRHGKLVIEFASLEDLERILGLLVPASTDER
jgi:ParB family chromosome partitioning protein